METTCPKCEQRYSEGNPPKKLINCQHVLCLACLSNEILCPIDRKRLERRKYTIQAFQTNQNILNLILGMPEQGKHSDRQGDEPPIHRQLPTQEINKLPEQVRLSPQPIQMPDCKGSFGQFCVNTEEAKQKMQESNLPRFQDINFETCLLHSKTADLICLKDKCLICSNCGLFGQHKNHDMLPYDAFVASFTTLIQQSFNNFELLKKSEELLEYQSIEDEINRIIKQKRENQIKNVKKVIAGVIQALKSSEKTLIVQLDSSLKAKKEKLLEEMQLSKLQDKVNNYYREIQKLSQGSIDIFKLENIERYIDYVDENSSKSYINKQGQYLISQIQNYSKTLRKKFNEEINQIQCKCNNKLNEIISNCFQLSNDQTKMIEKSMKQQKKIENSSEKTTLTSSGVVKKRNQEDLLINSSQNEQKKKKNLRSMSPIQPIPKFQQTFDNTFKNSYKQNIITGAGQEFFLRVKEVPLSSNHLFVPQHKKTISFGNKTINNTSGLKYNEHRKDIQGTNQNKIQGKMSSNNSSHIVEREILSALNENKKKKKLELPQKYMKIYDELQKDKLDVLDFGGAFLGDQMILSISELFESRSKLKSAKLMNNKISDQIFPDLLFRCRHLHSINLSYNNLTQKSLEWLEKQVEYLGNLSNITISNNKIVLRNVKDRIQNLRRKGVKVSL